MSTSSSMRLLGYIPGISKAPKKQKQLRQKLILKIGPNCCGKGVEGKALQKLHTTSVQTLTMRDLIREMSERDSDFASIATTCESQGELIPPEYIGCLFENIPLITDISRPVVWFDGVPREAGQVSMIADVFKGFEIIVHETRATDEHLFRMFLATLNSDDRQDRLDATEEIHHHRVALFRRNLPSILKAIRGQGWRHEVHYAHETIQSRVKGLLRIAELPLDGKQLQDIVRGLGLKKMPLLEELLARQVAA